MTWLVIGIGNTLRRDDGLGAWLADRIDAWQLPGVKVRTVHQLTPELAVEIAAFDRILFLDASRANDITRVFPVEAFVGKQALGHAMNPAAIMALAAGFGNRPPAWLATVPGTDFDFGESLSRSAVDAGERALVEIGTILREPTKCTKSG